jgi:hypothetical protein
MFEVHMIHTFIVIEHVLDVLSNPDLLRVRLEILRADTHLARVQAEWIEMVSKLVHHVHGMPLVC